MKNQNEDPVFTNDSMGGNYAMVGIGRGGQAPVATFGTVQFDRKGDFIGTMKQNQPSLSFGQREIVSTEFKGKYTINENGTGTLTEDAGREFIFVVTEANTNQKEKGVKGAIEISLIEKNLHPGTGNLLTFTFTRHPNSGVFDNRSLDGIYASVGNGVGGKSPGAGVGFVIYDGKGNSTGPFTQNRQGNTFFERIFQVFDFSNGTYKVNNDGTGTVTPSETVGAEADFVITKANVVDGIIIAEEIFFVTRGLGPLDGNLGTVVSTRIGDDNTIEE
jgi:hypothetical protein